MYNMILPKEEASNLGTIGKGILVAGAVGGIAGLGYWYWKKIDAKYNIVGRVSKIYIYPVKSCRGIPLQEARCCKLGFQSGTIRDREFLIVKSNGHFITARQEPTMLLISQSIHGDQLWLDAPGMPTLKVTKPKDKVEDVEESDQLGAPIAVTIWGENMVGLNCGGEAAQWLSNYLGKEGIKLVYFPNDESPRLPPHYNHWDRFKKTDNSIFADLTPYMLLSEASVDDLNSRLKKKISLNNFRPSFAIDGCKAYDEEIFKRIKIGDTTFRNVKPCNRCVLTTIDPETGIKDGIEPLQTLKTYKQMTKPEDRKLEGESPVFGVHLAADKYGQLIKVGDPIFATV